MAENIVVPTLGESVTEATVGRWLKKPGDKIATDEPVVELETDKVAVEVPAARSGIMDEILVQEGETVEVGAILGTISANATSTTTKGGGSAAAVNQGKTKGESQPTKIFEITVPAAGESVTEAQIGEWHIPVGGSVQVDQAIVELETDKAAQDIMAPVAGQLIEQYFQSGDTVEVGTVIGKIAVGKPGNMTGLENHKTTAAASTTYDRAPSPAASKILAERGLDANAVKGSGKHGQILKQDAIAAQVVQAEASTPNQGGIGSASNSTAVVTGGEERVKMTRLRKTIAKRLKGAQETAAILTTFNEVDMGAVMEMRKQYKELFEKKHGVKLGFMGFFTRAVCQALNEIPAINAEIDGDEIVYKNYCHIGVAVGTERGLVVPIVRNAEQMTIAEIEKEIGRLGSKARDGSLTMADMQGGTFTLSNGGVYGSLMSTPILNSPQSGILGMHKIQERPMAINGQVVIRPMMYLALSYDHRIVDGKEAVTFLVRVKDSLENPERLVLDL